MASIAVGSTGGVHLSLDELDRSRPKLSQWCTLQPAFDLQNIEVCCRGLSRMRKTLQRLLSSHVSLASQSLPPPNICATCARATFSRRRAEISTAIESVIRQRQVQEVASKLAHSDRCAPPGAWYAACAQQEDWPFTESQHVIKLSLYCSHYPWFFSANGFSALRVLVAAVTHEQPAVAYLPTSTPPPRSPPSP